MPRFRLTLEYDGRPFVGWQRQQAGRMSVQEALEDAVLRTSGERRSVHGAGRTDAGVHATGQVAHVDLAREWDAYKLQGAINFHLRPWPVSVLALERVAETFEARFSAIRRRYRYKILNRRAPPTFQAGLAWHLARPLDAQAMHAAAQALIGHHDFTTYRAAECQASSPMRTLDRLDARRAGDFILIEADARSFLHHQVRSLVGSLACVGSGKWPIEEPRAALEARDRRRCGEVCPPDGLYLAGVDYADDRPK